MPEIRVVGQKFFSKLKNGNDFDQEITDFSTHLKGGVLEDIKAVFNVQVQWYLTIEGGTSLIYIDSSISYARLEMEGKNFDLEGFSIGDTITITDPAYSLTGTISALSVGEMVFSSVVTDGTNGFSRPSQRYYLTGTTQKTALKYDFGLIENNEPINFLSKLTNTNQTYLFEGIDHNTPLTFVDGKTQGNNKAGYSGSASVAFVGYSANKDEINPQDTVQEFQIEHVFKINPFYRDGELDSLKGVDVPPLDLFNGEMSLKYVFQTEFRTVLSNPNTSMISEYDTQLGSVGYFDESFNGFESDFEVTNLNYEVNNIIVDRLEIGKITKVIARINSNNSLLASGNTPLIVGHSSIIDSSKYVHSDSNFNSLWKNESLRTLQGTIVSGSIIKNYQITGNSMSVIDFQFEVDLTSVTDLEDNQDYVVYFTLADPTKTNDEGTKVTGRLDVNYYYKNPDVAGLFDFDKLEQYPHPEPFEEGVTTGFTNALTFNESGMMADGRFWVLNEANLNSLKFDIAVFELNNNTWDSLRSLEIDLSDQTIVNGKQQIELDSTRGYVLDDGDVFNYLKITTDTNDGSKQYYNIQVGYKIPWQSWLEFKDAPTLFFNKSKPLNGLNQKASNYSLGVNYGIKVLFDAVVDKTNYVKTSQEIFVFDYDNQSGWTCEIQTYKKDPINDGEVVAIEGNIIQNDYTQVQAVFTPLVPPVFTSFVNMTEVATVYDPINEPLGWVRFAHGNKKNVSTIQRNGIWANEQANDTDTFEGTGGTPIRDKNFIGLYYSESKIIRAEENLAAFYGCVSTEKYETYSIGGTMYADSASPLNDDNDVIGYNIAFMTDEDGVEHTLSLLASTGGVLLDLNSSFVIDNPATDVFEYVNENANYALVYDFGKRGCKRLVSKFSSKIGQTWENTDLQFDIKKSGDQIEIEAIFTFADMSTYSEPISFNLNDDILTEKFKGFQSIGFSFMSQDQGGFKDVELTAPNDEFYSIIRIEPKNSQSDNVINEISSMIEAPVNNLLTQITGDSKLSTLEYDSINERFICKCLVDTSQIKSGQEYDFSTEIRPRNLER